MDEADFPKWVDLVVPAVNGDRTNGRTQQESEDRMIEAASRIISEGKITEAEMRSVARAAWSRVATREATERGRL